jgi:hypothetical protein
MMSTARRCDLVKEAYPCHKFYSVYADEVHTRRSHLLAASTSHEEHHDEAKAKSGVCEGGKKPHHVS